MKYNVYFIFSLDLFGLNTSKFSIDLLQCNLESQTPITFLFVNKNIIYEYAFSQLQLKEYTFLAMLNFSYIIFCTPLCNVCEILSSHFCQSYDVESFKDILIQTSFLLMFSLLLKDLNFSLLLIRSILIDFTLA